MLCILHVRIGMYYVLIADRMVNFFERVNKDFEMLLHRISSFDWIRIKHRRLISIFVNK